MGRLSAATVALTLACAALGLSACGSGDDELLPGETASEIKANIDAVAQLVAENDCIGAEDASATISGQVEALSGVDPKLQQALSEGAARLNEVVAECEEEPVEETVETIAPEETEGVEEDEKAEKPKKEKPEKEVEEPEEDEGSSLPPQSNGKGEEKGQGKGPPVEPETPSGGVGPGAAVEGE